MTHSTTIAEGARYLRALIAHLDGPADYGQPFHSDRSEEEARPEAEYWRERMDWEAYTSAQIEAYLNDMDEEDEEAIN
jgi:hypothetical protein